LKRLKNFSEEQFFSNNDHWSGFAGSHLPHILPYVYGTDSPYIRESGCVRSAQSLKQLNVRIFQKKNLFSVPIFRKCRLKTMIFISFIRKTYEICDKP
jgi:hypothetical protein